MICPHQDGLIPWPESDDPPHLLVHSVGSHVCEEPLLNTNLCSIKEQPRPATTSDRSPPRNVQQVPMKLQIRVSGQRGSLGISIAGGKGSLPYKDQDEGIFISRVTEGGPSEKAGVLVGDRLLEVNGLSMHRATHQLAVSALRTAGSSIRIKVLREQLDKEQQAPEDKALDLQCNTGKSFSRQEAPDQRSKPLKKDIAHNCLSRKIQAVVCNGNGIVDVNKEESLPEIKKEVSTNKLSFLEEKHTMLIPRIILTHPSTSDEDVELLTLSPGREQLYAFDICDRRPLPDCFDSAFYPP